MRPAGAGRTPSTVLADELVLAVRLDLGDVELRALHVAVLVERDREAEDRMRDLESSGSASAPRHASPCRPRRPPCTPSRSPAPRRRPAGRTCSTSCRTACCSREITFAVPGRPWMSRANDETYAPDDREVARVEAVRAEDLRRLALLLHLLGEELAVRGDLPGQEDDGRVVRRPSSRATRSRSPSG